MYIAVMGYGVVGGGVAEVIRKNSETIKAKNNGEEIEIKYILDLRSFPGDINESKIVSDFNIILNDPDVKVVVETMGGLHPAYEFVSACLKAGKSVCTSNKELVAVKGDELLGLAKENNANFMFEASVGGGIPIIRPLIEDLTANEITEVAGILNGTTNFILTKMIEDGMAFDDALKMAQQLGYAEKDPTADVDGLDACRKICILADLCFGHHILPDSVETEGIRNVTLDDVKAAEKFGGVIKLIARTKKTDEGKVILTVAPTIVRSGSQLGVIRDVFNGVLIRGNAVTDLVFYGRGAGKVPTASAVVADVIDCALHLENRKPFGWGAAEENQVASASEDVSSFLVRCSALDTITAAGRIAGTFGDFENTARSGKLFIKETEGGELVFETGFAKEEEIDRLLGSLGGINIISKYRILDF